MTVYAWPDALACATMEWGRETNNITHRSALTGSSHSVGLPTSRWVVGMNMPPQLRSTSGALEAFVNGLVGGVDRVTLHRFDRPVPMGTLRGSPTLAAGVTQFSDTLVLAGGSGGKNLLVNPSFELGATVATGWVGYVVGSVVSPVSSVVAASPAHGAKVQRVVAASTTTASSRMGVYQHVVGLSAGVAYTLSGQVGYRVSRVTSATNLRITAFISFRNALDAQIGSASSDINTPGATFAPISITAVAPAGTVAAYVYFWVMAIAVTADAFSIDVDSAQFEEGLTATSFSAGPGVKAGDMLGVGSQLFQVWEDAETGAGAVLTVKTVNRTRTSLASGAAVVWDRPTATFAMQDQLSAFSFGPRAMGPSSFRLVETY